MAGKKIIGYIPQRRHHIRKSSPLHHPGLDQQHNRLEGIDAFRSISIFAVIIIHCASIFTWLKPFEYLPSVGLILNNISRFAVPFFFITTGYLLGLRIKEGDDYSSLFIKRLRRLLLIYFVWIFIYGIITYNWPQELAAQHLHYFKSTYWRATNFFSQLIHSPATATIHGRGYHLWFLIALIEAFFIMFLFCRFRWHRLLLPLAIVLYIFGILSDSYSNTPIGIDMPVSMQDGPFYSLLFTTIGWLLASRSINAISVPKAISLVFVGCVLQFLEVYLVTHWRVKEVNFGYDGFVVGTVPFGVGVFLLAIRFKPTGYWLILSKWGKYTLGIYVIHLLFAIPATHYVKQKQSFLLDLAYPICVFFVSLLCTMFIAKIKPFRRLVI